MGLIFIWTHKILTPDVVHIMLNLDCRYVENLAWFKKKINNTHTNHPSSYFRRSKETLLIFKKVIRGDGFDIRHQRTADVVVDFEKPKSHWIEQEYTEPKPVEIYEMIETILPNSRTPTPTGSGRLLELWCKRNSHDRPGWISIHENKENDPTLSGNQTHTWTRRVDD
ncbi:hypothetical protein K493DRAFT_378432 [Basidiobolus meristosporus CBS 931.73]|uniref:Uncharacterized protein n=1 Tax=Basidiobolus meristosporus CBS 931.73 TaxID=1314790 RepID=A0A1Y1Y0V8_9FUNG|nr:hypothetical protein K493DRAFT_378432 [Basidiobolus meristosporus CBS 931.73]|eukprot:ORX91608.1 hypothetical protein K493DRAFT_378432 [Basidiobolus meristosporus CBS 931.73]